jgi:hypothetical protein
VPILIGKKFSEVIWQGHPFHREVIEEFAFLLPRDLRLRRFNP